MTKWMLRAVVILAASVLLSAQPAFDVISVRPNPVTSGTQFMMFNQRPSVHLNGDRFTQRQITLQYLIMQAYNVWDYQISGMPDWAKSPSGEHYEVEATVDSGKTPTQEELQLMLQALLQQRFGLKVHRETKDLLVYALIVAKSGVKLKEDPNPRLTMQNAINLLANVADRPVVDRTNLTGTYDFAPLNALHWAELGQQHRADPMSLPESLPGPLEDNLGLKLEPRKEQIDILVIDHAEKPSANN